MAALRNYIKNHNAGTFYGAGPQTEPLTEMDKDLLFTWQIGGADFPRLTEDSLRQTGICGGSVQGGVNTGVLDHFNDQHIATRVLHSCHQAGIIDATTGQPDTTKIDKNLANKIVIISRPKLKKLVEVLFFWEEEVMRWRLLTEEENELRQKLAAVSSTDINERTHLDETLKVIEAKKQLRPSMRDESGAGYDHDAGLPAYAA